MMADIEPPGVSILLLGDAECGKSTFLARISKGSTAQGPLALVPLNDSNQPFVLDVTLFSRPYRLEFSDTSSPETWTLLQPDIIIICFDVSSRLSLTNVQRVWLRPAHLLFPPSYDLPVLLLGLKRDLRRDASTEPGSVDPHEGYRVAQEMRCDRYLECSAVTGELVAEVFEDVCRTAALAAGQKGRGDEGGGGLSEGGCGIM